jgi:hypothetical protein
MQRSTPPPHSIAIWLAGYCVLTFLVYAPGLDTPRIGDDFDIVFDDPGSKVFRYFTRPNENSEFYRPLEAAFSAIVQAAAGTRTWPIQVTHICLHSLLAWWVSVVILGLGFSRLQAALGGIFMVVSQANVFAVLSNDTLSQVGATLCGCWALWNLYRAHVPSPHAPDDAAPRNRIDRGRYAVFIVLVVFALLFKESGISTVSLAIVLLVALKLRESGVSGRALRDVVREASLPVLLALSPSSATIPC